MKYFLNVILILCVTTVLAQTKIQFQLEGGKGFFSAYPPPEKPKGVLILLPDYLEDEDAFIKRTSIMNRAYNDGIVTVVVTVGRKIFADRTVVNLLSEVSQQVIEGFELPPDKVAFGGYGYGGTILLKFAQLCLKYDDDFPLTPSAIFAVHSHMDITLAFNSYERRIQQNANIETTQTAKNFKDIMVRTLGATPTEDPFIYRSYSPFVYGSASVDNIEMLAKTPIRLYHDTDLIWNMRNNKFSALDMECTASSEFIYQLRKLGNTRAELIPTDIENPAGGRNTAKRTFVDEKELHVWIVKQLGIE